MEVDFSLKGKVALVTGGSRGIGEATAITFAKFGADVVVVSRKLPELEIVTAKIKAMGGKALAVPAHTGHMEDIPRLVDEVVAKYGKIDILVNNAATNPTMTSAIDVDLKLWDTIMNTNLRGTFFLSQAVARVMRDKKTGGSIINVASAGGIRPHVHPSVYAISKGAIITATKTMANEWAQYGIRANVVAPGLVRTKFSEALWNIEENLKGCMERTPMKRIAEPNEIAGIMVYLASSASSFVTGAVFSVDGGETI